MKVRVQEHQEVSPRIEKSVKGIVSTSVILLKNFKRENMTCFTQNVVEITISIILVSNYLKKCKNELLLEKPTNALSAA